jgi:hypothetical protein
MMHGQKTIKLWSVCFREYSTLLKGQHITINGEEGKACVGQVIAAMLFYRET